MERNDGIVVSGGSFNAGNVAVGHGASAVRHGGDDPAQLLASLRELLADRPEALADVARVDAELQAPSLDHGRLRELLERITHSAGGIAAVATAVTALRAAIGV
jgi:chorismate mutase